MDFHVEPSPAGGYVVRVPGADAPVARHDTEEEAEDWVARHSDASPGPTLRAVSGLPRFAGLPDGTQVLLRAPRRGDGEADRDAHAVAEIPSIGVIAGGVGPAGVRTAPGWEGGALEHLLREVAESAQRD